MSISLNLPETLLGGTAPKDDIETYISNLTAGEQSAVASAASAIDVSILLNRARRKRGYSQAVAAELAGVKQQTISRLENSDSNPRFDTVRSYLAALGYALEIHAVDIDSNDAVEN